MSAPAAISGILFRYILSKCMFMSYDLNRSYLTIPGNLPANDAAQNSDGTSISENENNNPGNLIEHNKPDAAERSEAAGANGTSA